MTMLTPLGSGGRSRRRVRRWPRIVLALILLAAVGAGAFAAWRWLTTNDTSKPAAAQPTELCRTPTLASPKSLPASDGVSVEVANGTDRAGLAVDTADQLAGAGFDVTDIGNTDRPVKKGVAVVRYTPDDLASAITVASYVPGAELVEVEKAPSGAVALWLGPEFERVVGSHQADPTSVELPPQHPICRTTKP